LENGLQKQGIFKLLPKNVSIQQLEFYDYPLHSRSVGGAPFFLEDFEFSPAFRAGFFDLLQRARENAFAFAADVEVMDYRAFFRVGGDFIQKLFAPERQRHYYPVSPAA